jgi:hypothetical protein
MSSLRSQILYTPSPWPSPAKEGVAKGGNNELPH